MRSGLNALRFRDPRFLLMYSALQFGPEEQAKPDGSLSLPYVAGALRRAGYAVSILDVSVGGPDDRLEDTFFKTTLLPSGLIRCGLPPDRGPTKPRRVHPTATDSEAASFELRIDPTHYGLDGPVGMISRFFDAGADLIVLSEAEKTILDIAEAVRGRRDLTHVPGIAYRDGTGREVVNSPGPVTMNLDELPFPAWDLLPLDKYWDLSRPHGGQFPEGQRITYASLQTSRGCPFQCLYCHISQETEGHVAGAIGNFRVKSIDRVLAELQTLKDLGAHYIYFEDDSLFAKKKRAYTLFKHVAEMGLDLSDVNARLAGYDSTILRGVIIGVKTERHDTDPIKALVVGRNNSCAASHNARTRLALGEAESAGRLARCGGAGAAHRRDDRVHHCRPACPGSAR